MFIHLDPVGGIAGDMFIAAITDVFPHLREGVLAAIRAAGVPASIDCRFEPAQDHGLTGSRFLVEIPAPSGSAAGHDAGAVPGSPYRPHTAAAASPLAGAGMPHAAGDHAHRHFADIRASLEASALSPEVRHHAIGIFTVLAEAEACIHGHPLEQVSFHELGEWDSVADIVGAAYLITALGAREWSIGTLPLGSGFVQTAHGRLPVPVPATSAILQGFAFADDGVPGERITPTGAAIVRHLACRQQRHAAGTRILKGSGHGFGTRRMPGLANMLRVLAFDPAEEGDAPESSTAALISFEVDDQTPEDLAVGLDKLRNVPGVLDVIQTPVFGKKGRVSAQIQVLAEPDALTRAVEACFMETTTIGLRHQLVQRQRLPREISVVQVGNHAVRVKVSRRVHEVTVKAENDDIAPGSGSAARTRLRHAAEAAALEPDAERGEP
jgi:uncharacterized protein (TIGR00299 family) protein